MLRNLFGAIMAAGIVTVLIGGMGLDLNPKEGIMICLIGILIGAIGMIGTYIIEREEMI